MKMSGQLHVAVAFPPREKVPGTHWIGGWVGLTAGLDAVEERKISFLPGIEPRFHSRPARSVGAIQAELFDT
jgi:hypothetical protein